MRVSVFILICLSPSILIFHANVLKESRIQGTDGTYSNFRSDEYFERPLQPHPGIFKAWIYPSTDNCWEPIGIYNGLYPKNKIARSGCLGLRSFHDKQGEKSTIELYDDCHSGLIHVGLEKGQVLNGIQIHSQNDNHTMFNELYMSVIQDFIQDENQYEFENRQCSENLKIIPGKHFTDSSSIGSNYVHCTMINFNRNLSYLLPFDPPIRNAHNITIRLHSFEQNTILLWEMYGCLERWNLKDGNNNADKKDRTNIILKKAETIETNEADKTTFPSSVTLTLWICCCVVVFTIQLCYWQRNIHFDDILEELSVQM